MLTRRRFMVGCLASVVLHSAQCTPNRTVVRPSLLTQASLSASNTTSAAATVHLSPAFDLSRIQAFEQARARCRERDLNACFSLGEMYFHGWGAARNESLAQTMFRYGCSENHSPSCIREAEQQLYASNRESPVRGRASLQRLCDEHQLDACALLAHALKFGIGGSPEPARVDPLLETACPSTAPTLGCAYWALAHRAQAASNQMVRQRAQLSCEQHFVVGCRALAQIEFDRENREQSARILDQACTDDDAPSCALLATQVHATDPERARLLWVRSCTQLSPASGCADWANAQRDMLTGPERRELLNLSCLTENDAPSCIEVARTYMQGGVFDTDFLATMVQSTCDETTSVGCAIVAQIEVQRGTNQAEIERLFRRGCDGGDLDGCTQYGNWLREKNRTGEAVVIWARACRLGDAPACLGLAQHFNPGPRPSSNTPSTARARTFQWASMGCALDNGESCEMASRFAATTRDARALRERACRLGESDACGRQ